MTYAESIQFLYDLRMFGTKFGLDNTLKLAAIAGNPHHKLRFIHVAGTNGKGSTCAMLESIYRKTGRRVGLFTSPHLVSFAERIQVNRELISENEVARLVAEMRDWLKSFPADHHPTFFEAVTVMALRYFVEKRCDLVIWETGLGGRLDATNIVDPLASVITNIQYDHQKWLGETLDRIAFEKAGIIKASRPVITATTEPDAVRVIAETARSRNAPLTIVGNADAMKPPLGHIELPLLGPHQRINAAAAVATVRCLNDVIPVTEEQIEKGLREVFWPGRMQLFQVRPRQTIVVDGAHNSGGIEALRATLKAYFKHRKPALVLGILRDKDWRQMCQMLAPLARHIVLVPVKSERTADPQELLSACRADNPSAVCTVCNSIAEALKHVAEHQFIVITGSLYIVGEALEVLSAPGRTHVSERGLNEWFATAEIPSPSAKAGVDTPAHIS